MDNLPPRSFRKGDTVQAKEGNGAVPKGTIGTVIGNVSQPNLPKMVRVEWSLSSRLTNTPTKKSWCYTSHVEHLTDER